MDSARRDLGVLVKLTKALKAVILAAAYKLAFAPVAVLGAVLVPVAILFGVTRTSRLTGRTIFTAPDWLSVYGNEQDGYDPEWAVNTIYKGWPTFLRRYSWAAWRNKVRNLPFVPSLAWLHVPPTEDIKVTSWTKGRLSVEIHESGWMVELKASYKDRFLDIGPRLDQPREWGAVSWAFRPFGKN